VLVVGGSSAFDAWTAALEAELYDPVRDEWSVGAAADVPRQYHGLALLLPDGRVWTAGSNAEHRPENRELRMEYYAPPYLFQGARPVITSGPSAIKPGGSDFAVETPDGAAIASVVLSRCGSVTHGFDADQRVVFLALQSRTSTSVTVAAPPHRNVAPPGYYLLFLLGANGVPSIGRLTRVG
jgi:hypothetical protein